MTEIRIAIDRDHMPLYLIASFLILGLLSPHAAAQSLVPDTSHVITIRGNTHHINLGESVVLHAISNKGHEAFEWSMEENDIATVSARGKVIGLRGGTTLVIAKSTVDGQEGIFLLTVSARQDSVNGQPRTEYQNRGILLFPSDIDSVSDWPRMAIEAGLNTIGGKPNESLRRTDRTFSWMNQFRRIS